MKRLCSHILYLAKESGGVSNLQLQKVMYFSLGYYIKHCGIDELFKELYTPDMYFEAWQYGPVIPEIYHEYKKYGSLSILDEGEYHEELSFLNASINIYLGKDIFEMVQISHENKTWESNREKILSRKEKVIYEVEDLKNDFI